MKIFTGEIPINPCEKCDRNQRDEWGCINLPSCDEYPIYSTQLSILNQCEEINLSKHLIWFKNCQSNQKRKCKCCLDCPFSQFIQSEIKKQEGKDEESKML